MHRTVTPLPLAEIRAGTNDRTRFPEEALRELAASITAHGLAQPITVRRPCQDGEPLGWYEIVAGERRFRAVSLLGWETIPALIADLTDEEASAIMLTENIARADLDPVDEARAYHARMERFGWTLEEVSLQGGVSTRRVAARLKLLSLNPDLQGLVRTGDLSLGYAQILAEARLDGNRQRLALARLQANPSPAPAWFRRQCGDLKAQQAQEALLGGEEFTLAAPAAPAAIATAPELPPLPGETEAPRKGRTAEAILKAQVSFWTQAAGAWEELGKPHLRARCLSAASVLCGALEVLAAVLPPAPAAPPVRTRREDPLASATRRRRMLVR